MPYSNKEMQKKAARESKARKAEERNLNPVVSWAPVCLYVYNYAVTLTKLHLCPFCARDACCGKFQALN